MHVVHIKSKLERNNDLKLNIISALYVVNVTKLISFLSR